MITPCLANENNTATFNSTRARSFHLSQWEAKAFLVGSSGVCFHAISMPEISLFGKLTIPPRQMRNEYFSHLCLICGCYSYERKAKAALASSCDPFPVDAWRESMASRAGRGSPSTTFRGAASRDRLFQRWISCRAFAPCVSEMEKADDICFISQHLT